MSLTENQVVNELKELGATDITPETARLWMHFLPNLSPRSFFNVFSDLGIAPKQTTCKNRSGSLVISVTSDLNGQEVFRFEETFFHRGNPSQKVTELTRIELAESFQDKGVLGKILSALVTTLKRSGISKIELTANIDVGGYAFAKYGFYLLEESSNYEEFKQEVQCNFSKLKPEDLPNAKAMLSQVNWSDPQIAAVISVLPYAKTLLRGTSWIGYLNLGDEEQMELFHLAIIPKGDSSQLQ